MLQGSQIYVLTKNQTTGVLEWKARSMRAIADVRVLKHTPSEITTTLVLSVPALTNGTESTVTATITPSNATGTVTFKAGAQTVNGSITAGVATAKIKPAASGSLTVTASYPRTGTTTVWTASSAAKTVTVAQQTVPNVVFTPSATYRTWSHVDTSSAPPVRTYEIAGKAYHGRYSSNNGEDQSVVWFTGATNAAAATATATLTYANTHWFNGTTVGTGGGTIKVRAVTATSSQTVYKSLGISGTAASKFCAKGVSVDMTLPADVALGLARGTYKGLIFYTTPTQAGYGYFNPANLRLTITYKV